MIIYGLFIQGSPERVQGTFLNLSGWLCDVRGSPKTWIPFCRSSKTLVFRFSLPRYLLATPSKRFGAGGGVCGSFFGGLLRRLWQFDGGTYPENLDLCGSFGLVCDISRQRYLSGGLQRPRGDVFARLDTCFDET